MTITGAEPQEVNANAARGLRGGDAETYETNTLATQVTVTYPQQ